MSCPLLFSDAMKLDKFFALAAYAFQAFATLSLVFVVSHLLPAKDYGHYSLVVASSQSAAVLAFEWIRLAATRFCANVTDENSDHKKHTVLVSFACATLLIALLSIPTVVLSSFTWVEVALGVAIAVMIGATDLQLVFLRVQGSFTKFSMLQTSRATLLLFTSAVFAWQMQSAAGALAGLALGYVGSLVLFIGMSPGWWRIHPGHARLPIFKEMARYGLSAAAASVTALQVPLLLRWLARTFMPVESFAGFSLAMDILQKPFALVTSAIGGVLTPAVIVEFENKKHPHNPKLKQLYEVQFWAVMLVFGLAVALLPDVAAIVVKPALQEGLVLTGPMVGIAFALHTLIQSTIAIPGHLLKAGGRLIANAVAELMLVALVAGPCVALGLMQPYAWLWAVVVAVLLSGVYALPLLREVPCHMPVASVTVAPVVAALSASSYFWVCGFSAWLILKLMGLVAVCGLGLLAYRLVARRWG